MIENKHIVRVGPVHAGVIEPGVFRFTCSGERVERLDIELGFQHRGIEQLIVESQSNRLRMMCLAEQIAGDTTLGHALAMAQILEAGGANDILRSERRVALELERMAMSISTAGAMLGDLAYRLGLVSMQALRTLVVNTTQMWSGSRYGRTLIRPAGSDYRLTPELLDRIEAMVAIVGARADNVRRDALSSPSVLSRTDEICEMPRPVGQYAGDLTDRLTMWFSQIETARTRIEYECNWLRAHAESSDYPSPDYAVELSAEESMVSVVEGWRGRITHRAMTDSSGRIVEYKITDPSVELWDELALTMKGAEISDFPICNKSFNLSYCGVDL